MQPEYRKICLLAIVGIVLLASHCNSHQMSISNTWTLPQDGFTVFYRFFRDKISWYEADAVCQFHHANLVTVDNGVKYDASRAYLSDLNVTENVWIGLMRSQNSDRFMWSNSKILDREFGYWAEQIPAIESPLCAVVDPLRDYRWHSLRCGGPDVASFLCEMEAPEWATECLIRALPSLTIQYMADSATIELSRDCGAAEGIKRLTCNGKQDQDMIQRELMCMSERETITSDNEMKATNDEIPLDDEDVMLQSDNTENNNIDKMANQIESTVDKVGDKYNLDEVMMGDAPLESQEDKFDKPVKSMKKIASEKPLKNQPKQMRKLKAEQKEELMMGDQPAVSVPADEILPHVKKVINAEITKSEEIVTTPKTVVEFKQTTVEVRSRRETEVPVKSNHSATTESNIKINSEQIHSKATHKGILSFDHFIPPMLLVQHQNATAAPPSGEEADKTTTLVVNTTAEPMDEANQTSSTQVPTTISDDFTTNGSSVETSSTTLTTIAAVSNTTQETTTTPATTPAHIHHPNEYTKTNMMRPHAPKFGGEISYHAPNFTNLAKETIDLATVNESTTVTEVGNSTESMAVAANTTVAVVDAGSTTTTTVTSSEPSEQQTTEMTQTMNVSTTVTSVPHLEVAKRSNSVSNVDKYQHKQEHEQKPISHQHFDDANTKHADFTNSNLDYQYKPNRKRILTKPETHTYIQKIFG